MVKTPDLGNGKSNPIKDLGSDTSLDIVFLLSACTFLILPTFQLPGTQYLSDKLGYLPSLSSDPIGGMLTGLSALLIAVFFLTSRFAGRMWITCTRISIVCLLSIFFIVMPTVSDMAARHDMGLRSNGNIVSFAHDGGVLQTEAAVKFLLQGKSPYSADYHGTEMEQGMDSRPELWNSLGFSENPALRFYPYPPFILILSTPVYLLWNALFGWYDQRILHICCLAALAMIGYALPLSRKWKLPLMTLLILSPISVLFFVLGMNDILCTTFLMWTLLALTRKNYRLSALLLGLSCGLKQFAWILVPFYLAYLYTQIPYDKKNALRELGNRTWPLLASIVIIFVPFLVWDFNGLFNSLIVGQASIFPIRSTSLGVTNFFILFGWVSSHRDALPNVLFYLFVVLPISIYGIRQVLSRRIVSSMTTWYAVSLFAFMFFSRHFAHNYLGLLLAIISATYVIDNDEKSLDRQDQ